MVMVKTMFDFFKNNISGVLLIIFSISTILFWVFSKDDEDFPE